MNDVVSFMKSDQVVNYLHIVNKVIRESVIKSSSSELFTHCE